MKTILVTLSNKASTNPAPMEREIDHSLFEVERVEGGLVTIFLPGCPDPWSGSVCFMTEDRVTPLDQNMQSAVIALKGLGKGLKARAE